MGWSGLLSAPHPLPPGGRCSSARGEARYQRGPVGVLLEMMDAALDGRFKGLWAIGYDVYLTNPHASRDGTCIGGAGAAPCIQDMSVNETARAFAHVIFPACSSFEKDGTFMNAERRIHGTVGKTVTADGAFTTGLGDHLRCRPRDGERKRVRLPNGRGHLGRSASSMERGPWHLGPPGSRTKVYSGPVRRKITRAPESSHRDSFAGGARARLRAMEFRPTEETTNPEYPFLLTTGRTLHQFNAGTMTGRTANTVLRPTDLLEMAPADAARLALHDGEQVRLVEPVRRGGAAAADLRTHQARRAVRDVSHERLCSSIT